MSVTITKYFPNDIYPSITIDIKMIIINDATTEEVETIIDFSAINFIPGPIRDNKKHILQSPCESPKN